SVARQKTGLCSPACGNGNGQGPDGEPLGLSEERQRKRQKRRGKKNQPKAGGRDVHCVLLDYLCPCSAGRNDPIGGTLFTFQWFAGVCDGSAPSGSGRK